MSNNFSRKNISQDFSLLLSHFFSGSVPDFFSQINISEDFSLFLTILAVDVFLDQCQIIFPGKIFLRILAYFWVIFFWISSRFFFIGSIFLNIFSISDDFGSGFFSRSVSNNFSRKNISQDFSLLLSHFFLNQFQIVFFGSIFLKIFLCFWRFWQWIFLEQH